MRDELKDFIQQHKAEFDDKELPDQLWTKIEVDLDQDKKGSSWSWLKIAAIVLVSFSLGILVTQFGDNVPEITGTEIETSPYAELEDVEAHYTKLIAHKIEEVRNAGVLSEEEETIYIEMLDDMELEYQSMKEELQEGMANDLILEAMIDNLRERTEILEEILEMIKTYEDDDETIII